MPDLILKRFAYLKNLTRGELHIGDEVFQTIERPWIRTIEHLGGKNYESCVPDGTYVLMPFDSEDHPNCYILRATSLDVYTVRSSSPGRWGILIHPGNYVDDVVGCIAPGMEGNLRSVSHSVDAMNTIRSILKEETHIIRIEPKGAVN